MAKKKQGNMSHPLVAVELGGGSLRAIAAEMTPDGLLRILGAETAKNNKACVQRGVVSNTSNASFGVNEMLRLLANRIHCDEIVKVFVPMGGRSMKIVEVTSKRNQIQKKSIPMTLLDEMEKECKQKLEVHNPHVSVLGLVPIDYNLDGHVQQEVPTEQQAAKLLEIRYSAFVGQKELEQKVHDSFIRIPKHIECSYARPDVLLTAFASKEDWQEGVAVLDMGAQTTTLSVYKENRYIYNKVITQGGYDITLDIEQLGISIVHAERLKCQYGCAMVEQVEKNHLFRIPAVVADNGVLNIYAKDVAEIITNRLDQIFNPLMAELNILPPISVLYITGGASMLYGVEEYLQSKTSVQVMYGSHAPWLSNDTPDEYCAPNYASLVGTLLMGNSYRLEHPEEEPEDDLLKHLRKLRKKFEEQTLTIFTDTQTE